MPLAVGMSACSLNLDDPKSLVVYSDPSIVNALHLLPTAQTARFESSPNNLASVRNQEDGDVFVFADEHSARAAERAGLVEDVTEFGANTLVLVVPIASEIDELSDLAGLRVGICDEDYACGQASKALLKRYARNAKSVVIDGGSAAGMSAVLSDEAAAAIVYATDTSDYSNRVRTYSLPMDGGAPKYFVAVAARSPRKTEGRAFVASTLDTVGYAVLSANGFAS